MRPTSEIFDAFASAPRPSEAEITTGSNDDERREIRELLAPYRAHEVPGEHLGEYPLFTMFPFLSAAAYRYYMPRCIQFSLEHPENELCESLLFSLSGTSARERAAAFSPGERAVVRDYVEHLSRNPGVDGPFIEAARQLWK